MSLPKTMIISGCRYKIRTLPPLDRNYGKWDAKQETIFYNRKIGRQQKYATILHEALHAIIWAGGLREIIKGSRNEEMVVRTLEVGLVSMIRDNPTFFKQLIKELR